MKKFLLVLGIMLLSTFTANAQNAFLADSKIKVSSYIIANNTTAIVVKPSAGNVYSIEAYNNGAAVAYIKLYNAAIATCGSGTPMARYLIPFGATSSGAGFVTSNINGDAFGNGIVMCVTTGIADNDTGAPPASTFIVNVHYKQICK